MLPCLPWSLALLSSYTLFSFIWNFPYTPVLFFLCPFTPRKTSSQFSTCFIPLFQKRCVHLYSWHLWNFHVIVILFVYNSCQCERLWYTVNAKKYYLSKWVWLSPPIIVVQSLSSLQLFATLWTVAHKAPLSMEFSRQEYWSGSPFPSPGDLPNPGTELRSPALQADSLPSEPPSSTFFFFFSSGLTKGQTSLSFTSPIVCSNSCPLSWWHHPTISSSATPSPPALGNAYPSIRVFSNELTLCIRWPKYWSFSFSISPCNEYSKL